MIKHLDYAIRERLNSLRDRCYINDKLDEKRIDTFSRAIEEYRSQGYYMCLYDLVIEKLKIKKKKKNID